jgi:hypothetical protein
VSAPRVSVAPVPVLSRQYPHVDDIKDWRAQQSIRLLWDRVFALEARLQATETTAGDLVTATNAQDDQLQTLDRQAGDTAALLQVTRREVTEAGGGGPLPGGGDGGQGADGCAAAGSDGHVTASAHNAYEAGQIVCGTGAEFPALLAATGGDMAVRQANAEELLKRMIWHLKQAGFVAGLQRNPSGKVSNNKLCVITEGITRAYDVLRAANDPTIAMGTGMDEVAPPDLVDEAGIAD